MVVSNSVADPGTRLASPRQTVWGTNRPEQEGFYWYRNNNVIDVVRVYTRPGSSQFRATGAFFEQHAVGTMNGQWAGPIPQPTG